MKHAGVWYGLAAYFLWALFPLYFRLVADSGPFEIVAHRALWSLVFCLALLPIMRRWRELVAVLQNRRALAVLLLAGFLVAGNWTLYVWGVNTDRTLDAALGYFLNPLVSALLGVLVLGERLRRPQWVAFGIGAVALAILIAGYGQVPIIAFGVAITFGFYGLVKKRVGGAVGPLPGLAAETIGIAVLALGYLVWLGATGTATAPVGSGQFWLLTVAGPITAIPLLLFAAAASRVTLVTIGILQYVAPIGQFLIGWLAFGEPMPPERWAGFVLIWIAITVFVWDAVRAQREARAPRVFPTTRR